MKHSLKVISFIILSLILLMVLGCFSIPQGIQNLINTKTPTITITPTATATATATPLPPISIAPCAKEEDCPSIVPLYDYLVGSLEFDSPNSIEIPYNQPVWIHEEWSSLDEELLAENFSHIRWFFKIDGQGFFQQNWLESGNFANYADSENMYPGYQWGAVLDGWEIGQSHLIEVGYVIDEAMSDGWYDYEDGYTHEVKLVVMPMELPTATPTATKTLTPTATSTRIPYTNTPKPTAMPACDINSTIEIDNTTGGPLTLKLSGPASFKFNLGTGVTVLNVCPGSYSYEAWGCGGAYDSGSIGSNEAHEFYCN